MASPSANVCAASEACSTWTPSAYHSATRLKDGLDGSVRILIVGGLSGDSTGLVSTPNLLGDCPGNGYVLTLNGTNAQIQTVVRAPGTPSIERAFHSAVRSGDRVLIAGGWVLAPYSDRACSTPTECGDGICYDGACRTPPLNPGALTGSERWFAYDDRLNQFVPGGQLATPRFAHSAVTDKFGRVFCWAVHIPTQAARPASI